MKKLVLTGVLFLAFFAGFAQVPAVAMLDHKGTLTPYYGPAALQKAYAAADTGDIITLSPGLFHCQKETDHQGCRHVPGYLGRYRKHPYLW